MTKRSETAAKLLLLIPATLYLAALVRTVLWRGAASLETDTVHLVPFYDVAEYRQGLRSALSLAVNYIGNIALFFPLGLLLCAYFKKLKLLGATAIGFLVSVGVEIAQYVMKSGYADIDDLLMNTAGAFLGAFVFRVVLGGRKKRARACFLSLVLLLLLAFGGAAAVWYRAPQLLPDRMLVMGNRIAGRPLDSYTVRVDAYKMSHGEVFVVPNTAKDNTGYPFEKTGTYYIADTAIFAIGTAKNGEKTYRVADVEEMIALVKEQGGATVTLWLTPEGACDVVLLETDDNED